MKHLETLKNKKVLITGGTSGLGKALALQLKDLGAHVAIVARTPENIDQLIQQHPQIVGIQGDVSQKEEIYPIAGEVHAQLGQIDILFNVASYLGFTPLRKLIDSECEDVEKVFQTNLMGPFRLTKALLPSMILNQSGVVVNISSDAAVSPYEGWGGYGASKAALDQLSRIFNEELKGHGVHVLSIDPGDMDTPMHAAALPDVDPKTLKQPQESASQILNIIAQQDFSSVRRSL